MNDSNIDVLVRPKTISQLFTSSAENAIKKITQAGFVNHSFLLEGRTGGGKTTTARALASYLFTGRTDADYDLQESHGYIEVNSAKYTGVDNMRQLLDEVAQPPLIEDKIVLVLDEAQELSKQAQSALQKPLEEPQSHLYIMLLTNEPNKLKLEVRNRCQRLQFQKPNIVTLTKFAQEYAIPNILSALDEQTTSKCETNIRDILDGSKSSDIVSKIIDSTDMSLRAVVIKAYEFILTGEVTSYEDTKPEVLSKIYKVLVNPSKSTWRKDVREMLNGISNPDDTRKALCNYMNVVLVNNLTSGHIDDIIHFMTAIRILKDELSYSSQKADFTERVCRIVLTNAAVIK